MSLVYQLSVPILYHIYKQLSSDLNTYFKIIYNYFLYSLKRGDFPRTLFISLLIKERGNGCYALFLLLIKERRCGYPNLFIFLFSISIKKGDLVSSPVYQLYVPVLYHIYKHLSTNLNTYFKIIFYFFTH